MMLSTILMAGQTIASGIQGAQANKSASKIADIQRGMAHDDLMYNRGQLYEYANQALSANFSQYAQARADQLGEYQKMSSDINTMASAQGVNMEDSSFADDVENRLDFEYETNLQNMLSNQIDQLSGIVAGVSNQDYQIQKQYNDSIYGINQAQLKVEQQSMDKFYQNLGNTLISVADGISATGAKNKNNTTVQNMKTYFSTVSW